MATFRTANQLVVKQAGKAWSSLNAESLKQVTEWTKVQGSSMDAQSSDDFVLADNKLIDVTTGEKTTVEIKDNCRLLRLKENHFQETSMDKANQVLLMNQCEEKEE